jgi:nucleotidyltransferase/DNA polymerase involved in DNA repair
MDCKLRNRVVVTGGERGAVTSVSVEGKKMGLGRGMTLREIKIRCPEAVIVPSDYTSYSMFACRMYSIVRTYTPFVEEYSIDECFADITDLGDEHESYEDISLRIKNELEESLGITFGVGLAPTKTLAKIASKAHKPAGFTPIGLDEIPLFLEKMPIHAVWGFGGASGTKLQKLGAETAYAFIQKEDAWFEMNGLGKVYRDLWLELRGESVNHLKQSDIDDVGSLMRTRTFSPPSMSRSFIFSQLSKNVEEVCEKARRHHVKARGLSFYLKTQEFTYHSVSIELTVPVVSPIEILKYIEAHFDEVWAPGILYRASGVTIRGLVADRAAMPDLFGELGGIAMRSQFIGVIDEMSKKYGRHTISLGSSLAAITHAEAESKRKKKNIQTPRDRFILSQEKRKKTLYLPYLGVVK